MAAIAAVDTALWDIKAKAAGHAACTSCSAAASRDGVLAYAHANGGDDRRHAGLGRAPLDRGYRAVRVQSACPAWRASTASGGPERVRARRAGRAVRRRCGRPRSTCATCPRCSPRVRERVRPRRPPAPRRPPPPDADRGGAARQGGRGVRAVLARGPGARRAQEGFRLIRQHTTTPLAVGEVFNSIWDCEQLISEQLIDYIRTAVTHAGGISHVRRIFALAELLRRAHRLATAPPTSRRCAWRRRCTSTSRCPNFGIQEYMPPHRARPTRSSRTPTRFEDGYLHPGEGPGLGVELDEALAAKYPYRPAYLPVARRRTARCTAGDRRARRRVRPHRDRLHRVRAPGGRAVRPRGRDVRARRRHAARRAAERRQRRRAASARAGAAPAAAGPGALGRLRRSPRAGDAGPRARCAARAGGASRRSSPSSRSARWSAPTADAGQVMDDATPGPARPRAGRSGTVADADHLKTPRTSTATAAAGFSFFTIDPSDHVDRPPTVRRGDAAREVCRTAVGRASRTEARDAAALRRPPGRCRRHPPIALTRPSRCARRRNTARRSPTSPRSTRHLHEGAPARGRTRSRSPSTRPTRRRRSPSTSSSPTRCRGSAYSWVSLAPRFVGRFEKGVDYLGRPRRVRERPSPSTPPSPAARPVQAQPPHRLGQVHDLPASPTRLARRLLHLKTAGTSYLEALRAVALHDEALMARIFAFALERFAEDRATYHLSAGEPRPGAGGPRGPGRPPGAPRHVRLGARERTGRRAA